MTSTNHNNNDMARQLFTRDCIFESWVDTFCLPEYKVCVLTDDGDEEDIGDYECFIATDAGEMEATEKFNSIIKDIDQNGYKSDYLDCLDYYKLYTEEYVKIAVFFDDHHKQYDKVFEYKYKLPERPPVKNAKKTK